MNNGTKFYNVSKTLQVVDLRGKNGYNFLLPCVKTVLLVLKDRGFLQLLLFG